MAILSINFFLTASLIFIFLTWLKRILWMSHFRHTHPPLDPVVGSGQNHPKVSVIIPAKDEEKNIPNCLSYLFKQNYTNFEILVVDDRSADRTAHLLENFKTLSPVPFKIIRIEKLPPVWTGKNHAMFAASRAALGEWLLFTDADTTHQPESISTAVHCVLEKKIDFLTLAPEVDSRSFWEKTVQPLAVSSLALWFQTEKVNDPKSGVTLANGQFLLIRKEAYEKIGGNEAVKNEVVEDVELAKKFRAGGYSVQFLNGTRIYSTRMYDSLKEIRTGWTRIFTYLFNKNAAAILHKIFLFLYFSIFPFVVLAAEKFFWLRGSTHFDLKLFILSGIVSMWIILIRFFGNKFLKANPWYAFLHPLGSAVMVWILAECLERVLFNKPSAWRGDLHR